MRFNVVLSFAVLVAFLAASIAPAGDTSKPDDFQSAFTKGNTALDKRDFASAIHCFTDAIGRNPKSADAYRLRGHAYVGSNECEKAIADYTEALHLSPNDSEAYQGRGSANANLNHEQEAIADYTAAIRLNPKNVDAYICRSRVHCKKGENKEAISDCTEAIRFDPKNSWAFVNRAYAFDKAGEIDKAIADYSEVIRLDPKNADAFSNRGTDYSKKQACEKAISDIDEAIRLDPKNSNAFLNRGLAYAQSDKYDKAIVDLTETIRLDPKNSLAYHCRGAIQAINGQNNKAIVDFTESIRLDPKYAPAFMSRGNAYENLGESDKALADYSETIRLDPKAADAYYSRGLRYSERHEYEKAIGDFTEAIRLNPKDCDAFGGRGYAHSLRGETEEAIADLSEEIRLDPKNARAFICRGSAYANQGENEKAIADYSEALRLDPKNSQTFSARAAAYANKSECDKAIADYGAALRLEPTKADFFLARAYLFETKGDKTQATQDYNEVSRLRMASLQRELHLPPADKQSKTTIEALEKRIAEQVKALKYDDKVARDLLALVHDWNLVALSRKLARARDAFQQRKLSQPELVVEERDVAELLARLIESAIRADYASGLGHELTEVMQQKCACCQGYMLLYFVLGNAIGLPVRGLDVIIAAEGPYANGNTHDACLVRLADGLTIMVDVTRGLGDRVLVSKPFRFDDIYQPDGSYWKIKAKLNALSLHRVVRPLETSGLLAQRCTLRQNSGDPSGELERALADASEAIGLDPKSATDYTGRGNSYISKGDYDRAIADYTEAIRLCPDYCSPYGNRGWCYFAKNEFDKAIVDYSDAIRLSPDHFDTYTRRGSAFGLKGDFEKAIADYTGASRATKTPAPGAKTNDKQLIGPLDVIQVYAQNPLPYQPLDGTYCLVMPEGYTDLGPSYGGVLVAGMNYEQAKSEVEKSLSKLLRNPGALLRFAGRAHFNKDQIPTNPYHIRPGAVVKIYVQNSLPDEPINGDFKVSADGTVDLGKRYGKVSLKDMTPGEARDAIEVRLQKLVQNPGTSITLAGWSLERSASPVPSTSELIGDYNRNSPEIYLPGFKGSIDSETAKKVKLTDQQRHTLLRLMAEERIRKCFADQWEYSPEMLRLPAEKQALHVAAFDLWCEERKKDMAKDVKALLTPEQLNELDSDPALKRAAALQRILSGH